MKIPKIREIIPVAPLRYVDLDAIINHCQTERSAKISAYISVVYPDEQGILLLKKGELFSAGKIVGNEFTKTSLAETLKKMRTFRTKDEDASLNFCEIDPALFICITNKFFTEPQYANLNTKYTDVRKLFQVIIRSKYNGFIEFIYKNTENFIFIEDGELSYVYFCDELEPYIEESLKTNDITLLLETIIHLFNEEEGGYINIFNKPEEIQAQLSPRFINLMEQIIEKTLKVLGKEHSVDNLVKYFTSGVEKVSQKVPEIKNAVITKDKVDLSAIELESSLFTASISLVFNEFIDKLNLVFMGMAVVKVYEIIKDFRFALEEHGFFEKSYMKGIGS